jgi:hypothetical protein
LGRERKNRGPDRTIIYKGSGRPQMRKTARRPARRPARRRRKTWKSTEQE